MKTTFGEYMAGRVDGNRWIVESYAELDDPVPWAATRLDIAATSYAPVGGGVGEPIRFRTPMPRDFSSTSALPSPVPSGASSAVRSRRNQMVRGGCSGLQCGHQRFDHTTGHNILNASAAGMFPIGVAMQAAGTNDTTCRVRVSGIPVTAVLGGGG
jgi:hypothetical protein